MVHNGRSSCLGFGLDADDECECCEEGESDGDDALVHVLLLSLWLWVVPLACSYSLSCFGSLCQVLYQVFVKCWGSLCLELWVYVLG